MKIATWNLWNTPFRQLERLEAAADTLRRLDADIVVLQEVAIRPSGTDTRSSAEFLAEQVGYPHVVVSPYPADPGEGLAVLSRTPLDRRHTPELDTCALGVETTIAGTPITVTNVHLDWASIAVRERQAVHLVRHIAGAFRAGGHDLLCGDFNAVPESSIYRFLRGQQTLLGEESNPWLDLDRLAALQHGAEPGPTLDFWTNPRWTHRPTLEIPCRVDWLLLRDTYGPERAYPTLVGAERFGIDPCGPAMVVPSDHYGVVAEVQFVQHEG